MENYWNNTSPFPNFKLLFREPPKEPPTWFNEMLMTAFIHDYAKVTNFQDIMKLWKNEEAVKFRDEMFTLFSENEVALPYLSMGLNQIYNEKNYVSETINLVEVDRACVHNFQAQQRDSEGRELTIKDYVTRKMDMASMLDLTYGLTLYALFLFRRDKPSEYGAVTEDKVNEFLKVTFKNSVNPAVRLEQAAKDFFDAIEKYEKGEPPIPAAADSAQPSSSTAPQRSKHLERIAPKEEKFFQRVFDAIRHLHGFHDYLLQFKGFVHNINTFIEFAMKSKSSLLEKDKSIKEHREENM